MKDSSSLRDGTFLHSLTHISGKNDRIFIYHRLPSDKDQSPTKFFKWSGPRLSSPVQRSALSHCLLHVPRLERAVPLQTKWAKMRKEPIVWRCPSPNSGALAVPAAEEFWRRHWYANCVKWHAQIPAEWKLIQHLSSHLGRVFLWTAIIYIHYHVLVTQRPCFYCILLYLFFFFSSFHFPVKNLLASPLWNGNKHDRLETWTHMQNALNSRSTTINKKITGVFSTSSWQPCEGYQTCERHQTTLQQVLWWHVHLSWWC